MRKDYGRYEAKDRSHDRRFVRRAFGKSCRAKYTASTPSVVATIQLSEISGSNGERRSRWPEAALQWKASPWRPSLEFLSLKARGFSARVIILSAFLVFVFWHGMLPAHASSFIDGMQSSIQNISVQWMNNSLQQANILFNIMMVLSFVVLVAQYYSINHTIEGLAHPLMDFFLKVIPLWVILEWSATVLPNVGATATALGGQITGTPVTGPSEIFGLGIKTCSSILSVVTHHLLTAPTPGGVTLALVTGVVALLASIAIVASFTLIAFEYFFAFAQAYITLSIGAVSLGWIGASGTKHMGESYLSGVWMSIMRLVVTVAVVGFIVSIMPNMEAVLSTNDPQTIFISWIQLACGSAFSALLAVKVPAFAGNIFSGRPVIGSPEVAQTLVRAARNLAR